MLGDMKQIRSKFVSNPLLRPGGKGTASPSASVRELALLHSLNILNAYSCRPSLEENQVQVRDWLVDAVEEAVFTSPVEDSRLIQALVAPDRQSSAAMMECDAGDDACTVAHVLNRTLLAPSEVNLALDSPLAEESAAAALQPMAASPPVVALQPMAASPPVVAGPPVADLQAAKPVAGQISPLVQTVAAAAVDTALPGAQMGQPDASACTSFAVANLPHEANSGHAGHAAAVSPTATAGGIAMTTSQPMRPGQLQDSSETASTIESQLQGMLLQHQEQLMQQLRHILSAQNIASSSLLVPAGVRPADSSPCSPPPSPPSEDARALPRPRLPLPPPSPPPSPPPPQPDGSISAGTAVRRRQPQFEAMIDDCLFKQMGLVGLGLPLVEPCDEDEGLWEDEGKIQTCLVIDLALEEQYRFEAACSQLFSFLRSGMIATVAGSNSRHPALSTLYFPPVPISRHAFVATLLAWEYLPSSAHWSNRRLGCTIEKARKLQLRVLNGLFDEILNVQFSQAVVDVQTKKWYAGMLPLRKALDDISPRWARPMEREFKLWEAWTTMKELHIESCLVMKKADTLMERTRYFNGSELSMDRKERLELSRQSVIDLGEIVNVWEGWLMLGGHHVHRVGGGYVGVDGECGKAAWLRSRIIKRMRSLEPDVLPYCQAGASVRTRSAPTIRSTNRKS